MLKKVLLPASLLSLLLCAATAHASNAFGVYITEFLSNSGGTLKGEFVEITNTSSSPVDMTGWSEDDSNNTPNKSGHSLSAFGTLAPGESAIFTEATPSDFRTSWGLPASVKVIGPYTNDNLGSTADSVTLFDSTGTLVDRLDYDASGPGSVTSRNPGSLAALGANNNSLWVNSSVGDSYGSYAGTAPQASSATIANPGVFNVVPEPASMVLGLIGFGALGLVARRRTV